MPRVGLEPTIPALEWAKTVYALHRAATVIGIKITKNLEDQLWKISYLSFGPGRYKQS
jgi:hypothetical protein